MLIRFLSMPVRGSRHGPGWIGGHPHLLHERHQAAVQRHRPAAAGLIQCLKTHKKEMSVGCAQALQKLKAKKQ